MSERGREEREKEKERDRVIFYVFKLFLKINKFIETRGEEETTTTTTKTKKERQERERELYSIPALQNDTYMTRECIFIYFFLNINIERERENIM